jgi:hypothetical protein
MEPSREFVTRYRSKSGLQIFSSKTVLINEWFIKASISNFDSIIIFLQNINSGEIKIGFFTDELEANKFVCLYTDIS